MKRNRIVMMSSIMILLVIGGGLLYWVFGDGIKEKSHIEKETKQNQEQEIKQEQEETQEIKNETEHSEIPDLPSENPIQEPEKKEVTMAFTGDILLSSYVRKNYDGEGIGGVVSDTLLGQMQGADITMANEEFPFSTRGVPEQDKQFTFQADPAYTSVLKDMGIDVVTLANNHALDYGAQALTDTFQALDETGIAYVGAGDTKERASQPYFIEAGGKTFGFLAASRVIPQVGWNIDNQQPGLLCTYDSSALVQAIQGSKEKSDYVVVYVHWGVERANTPQEYQRQLGKAYIDAGADLVIGSHPHVLQGIEYYQGKPIVYSLGNYIFNQEIPSTVLLKATVSPDNQTTLTLLPAYAVGAKTQEKNQNDAAALYQFMEEISFGITVGEDGVVSN
ncbi:MAG: CapA family protein [Lachnospiraceae bacterium]